MRQLTKSGFELRKSHFPSIEAESGLDVTDEDPDQVRRGHGVWIGFWPRHIQMREEIQRFDCDDKEDEELEYHIDHGCHLQAGRLLSCAASSLSAHRVASCPLDSYVWRGRFLSRNDQPGRSSSAAESLDCSLRGKERSCRDGKWESQAESMSCERAG